MSCTRVRFDEHRSSPTFQPCGIWKLESDDGGATWRVIASGADNTGHVTANDPTTYSWGFEHTKSKDSYQSTWEAALALGPTQVNAEAVDAQPMKTPLHVVVEQHTPLVAAVLVSTLAVLFVALRVAPKYYAKRS